MKTVQYIIFLIVFFVSSTSVMASGKNNTPILLQIPESVIREATTAILPLPIDASSKTLQGDITIVSIKDLQLTDGHLACTLQLAGKNLNFLTEIAGHEIKLKVGNVKIGFSTDAEISYDRKTQTLFLKPVVRDVVGSGDGKNGEIGKALLALLNGREFPVTMQDIEPLLARSGSKTIAIETRIEDIRARENSLELKLLPKITVKQ